MWREFDTVLLDIVPHMSLKSLASIFHGLHLRSENGIFPESNLTGALLLRFLKKYYRDKRGPVYNSMSVLERKYTRICLKTLTNLTDHALK